MADFNSNIDLVFRNGLKDLEVLPPADVWDNIRPVIRKKQRSFLLLRIAAIIVLVLSVGITLAMLTREISDGIGTTSLTLNQEVMPEGEYVREYPAAGVAQKTPLYKAQERVLIAEPIIESSAIPAYINFPLFDKPRSESSNILANRNNRFSKEADDNFITSAKRKNFNFGLNQEPGLLPQPEYPALKRWSISAMAAPTYYMAFTSNSNEYSRRLQNAEKSIVSYSGGFSFSYNINKKLSIQSGLYYSSIGQEVSGINSYAGFEKYVASKSSRNFEVLTTSGNVLPVNRDIYLADGNMTDRVLTMYTLDVFDPVKSGLSYLGNSLFQDFRYLEMPVVMKYKLIDKKFDVNLIGGLSYNLLVDNSVFAMVEGSKMNIAYTDGLNPSTFSGSFGMGMEYNMSEKFSFNLEPTIRYFLSPLGEQLWTQIHPYSFGIFTGVSYKF
jgi:hypothetical protein